MAMAYFSTQINEGNGCITKGGVLRIILREVKCKAKIKQIVFQQ
jgi:hypothetical protein